MHPTPAVRLEPDTFKNENSYRARIGIFHSEAIRSSWYSRRSPAPGRA
jgi:hypothetical protein